MLIAALIVGTIICIEAFLFLRLDFEARGVIAVARGALAVLADRRLSDEQKESCARRAVPLILKMTTVAVLKLAAIAGALYVLYLGAAWAHPPSASRIVAALTSPLTLMAMTLAASAYVWMRNAILR
jgi:hypothetical protein